MKKLWILGFLAALILLIAITASFLGCGTVTSGERNTAVVMQGATRNAASASAVMAQKVKTLAWAPGQNPGNPNYPIIIATPESYSAGIYRARLFRTLADSSPYLIATWGTIGSAPGHFDLSGTYSHMASNADYPAAGSYTHMVPTLGYLQQELPASLIDFGGITRFRAMVAAYGDYQRGDVLVFTNEAWSWIDQDTGLVVAARPTHPVKVDWGSDATVEVSGHIVFEPIDVSVESVIMPDNPSGVYTINFIFDIASTFMFNDVNNDGIFQPGREYPAGDVPTAAMRQTSGEAEWSVGPPSLQITITH